MSLLKDCLVLPAGLLPSHKKTRVIHATKEKKTFFSFPQDEFTHMCNRLKSHQHKLQILNAENVCHKNAENQQKMETFQAHLQVIALFSCQLQFLPYTHAPLLQVSGNFSAIGICNSRVKVKISAYVRLRT